MVFWIVCVLLLIFSEATLHVLAAASSDHHPCRRLCLPNQPPLVCQYNFTIEWYRTLSKACWDCPFKMADCFRPQCVSGDGRARPIVVFNRQMPGPAIEVCESDTVQVWVTNMLSDGATASVHWHGMHQRGTPYMDGVPHLTQCAIGPGETFRYEFSAFPAGTHWYHSHSGMQLGDGALGPLVVHKPPDLDPARSLYDLDLSEHVLLVMDWMPETSHDRFVHLMHDAYRKLPMGALINGRNMQFQVPNEFNTSGSPLKFAQTPPTEFRVEKGLRYRFRIISAAQKCPFRLFFDKHVLQIIASDGMTVSPVFIDSIMMGPGERYDVVIEADQPVSSYWVRAMGLRDCYDNNATAVAVLKYANSSVDSPAGDPYLYVRGTLFGPLPDKRLRPGYDGDGQSTVTLEQLNSTEGHVDLTHHPPDVVHYVAMDFLPNDNSRFNDLELYPVNTLPLYKSHFTPTMNNITYQEAPVPLLSQPEDIHESWFCNRSSIKDMDRCRQDLCRCTHRLLIQPGQTVEIVFVVLEAEAAGHPMHLHGYNFYLLAMEEYPEPFTIDHLEAMDRQGLLPRKLISPPLKDTINIPSKSYAILRFTADNPGIWFFHCHIETHLGQGKALILQVGHHSDFPPLPDPFSRCGGYATVGSRRQTPTPACQDRNDASSASHGQSHSGVLFLQILTVMACLTR